MLETMAREEREESIRVLKMLILKDSRGNGKVETNIAVTKAIMNAIEALEQDSSEDCVSRKEVHEMLENVPINPNDKWFNWLQKACLKLADLPSVKQEPKAEWIPVDKECPKDAVLACDMYGCMIAGIIYKDENSAETGYTAEDEGCCLIDVVAWQPLPKPYSEASE